jgi:hypothetical protein
MSLIGQLILLHAAQMTTLIHSGDVLKTWRIWKESLLFLWFMDTVHMNRRTKFSFNCNTEKYKVKPLGHIKKHRRQLGGVPTKQRNLSIKISGVIMNHNLLNKVRTH